MAKWYDVIKQDIMGTIRQLFELSSVDFNVVDAIHTVYIKQSNENILSEAFEISFTVRDEDFKLLVVHPAEGKFLFKRIPKGYTEGKLDEQQYAVNDEGAIRWINKKIINIERGNTEW